MMPAPTPTPAQTPADPPPSNWAESHWPEPDLSPEAIEADQLAQLTQYGMNIARLIHDTIDRLAPELLAVTTPLIATERLAPLAQAFDRTARTIRQTIALNRRLRRDTSSTPARSTARRQIIRRIEARIDETTKDPRENENLLRDLHERLDDPALDEDIALRPLNDIIKQLQEDMGIGYPSSFHIKPRTPQQAKQLGERASKRSGALPPAFVPSGPSWGQGTPDPMNCIPNAPHQLPPKPS